MPPMSSRGGPTQLPTWAANLRPLTMDGAAAVLGVCRRTLVEIIKRYPHFEPRGTRKVFYPEHIEALREDLRKWRGSNLPCAQGFTTPSAPLPGSAYERAFALAAKDKPRNSVRNMKRGSGNVIPMAST